jgi:hypothetical protein
LPKSTDPSANAAIGSASAKIASKTVFLIRIRFIILLPPEPVLTTVECSMEVWASVGAEKPMHIPVASSPTRAPYMPNWEMPQGVDFNEVIYPRTGIMVLRLQSNAH